MTFDFSEFKNKKIIVTGSSTGIGFETGVEFLIFKYRLNIYAEHFFQLNIIY